MGGLRWVVTGAAVIGVLAVLYVIARAVSTPGQVGSLGPLARGPMSKLQSPPKPQGYPPIQAIDAAGKPVDLASLKGNVVVLNLWATWCGPCQQEMPTLAALQTAYGPRPVKVVAIDTDDPAHAAQAKAFIARNAPLTFYQDPKFTYLTTIKPQVQGLPTTLIFDRTGTERAILAGQADWSSPEAHAVVDKLLGS
jgi:thiol-disulfide isomerase/thioredoxin